MRRSHSLRALSSAHHYPPCAQFPPCPPLCLFPAVPAPHSGVVTDRPDQPDTLPPLDERQARVISAFVSTPGPLTDTAKALGLSLPDLLAVLASEPVRAHLEAARDATELKFQLTAAAARDAALETLKTITRDAEADPIERRRAASAILRALTRRRRTTSAYLSPPGERAGVRGLLQWAGTPSGAGVPPAISSASVRLPLPAGGEDRGVGTLQWSGRHARVCPFSISCPALPAQAQPNSRGHNPTRTRRAQIRPRRRRRARRHLPPLQPHLAHRHADPRRLLFLPLNRHPPTRLATRQRRPPRTTDHLSQLRRAARRPDHRRRRSPLHHLRPRQVPLTQIRRPGTLAHRQVPARPLDRQIPPARMLLIRPAKTRVAKAIARRPGMWCAAPCAPSRVRHPCHAECLTQRHVAADGTGVCRPTRAIRSIPAPARCDSAR